MDAGWMQLHRHSELMSQMAMVRLSICRSNRLIFPTPGCWEVLDMPADDAQLRRQRGEDWRRTCAEPFALEPVTKPLRGEALADY